MEARKQAQKEGKGPMGGWLGIVSAGDSTHTALHRAPHKHSPREHQEYQTKVSIGVGTIRSPRHVHRVLNTL